MLWIWLSNSWVITNLTMAGNIYVTNLEMFFSQSLVKNDVTIIKSQSLMSMWLLIHAYSQMILISKRDLMISSASAYTDFSSTQKCMYLSEMLVSVASGNGLSPVWINAITWTNAALLTIKHTHSNYISFHIYFYLTQCILNVGMQNIRHFLHPCMCSSVLHSWKQKSGNEFIKCSNIFCNMPKHYLYLMVAIRNESQR